MNVQQFKAQVAADKAAGITPKRNPNPLAHTLGNLVDAAGADIESNPGLRSARYRPVQVFALGDM